MSKCELKISLERKEPTYHPGDKIQGMVAVKVDDSCKCRNLVVGPRWRTHGSGNEIAGPSQPASLFQGEWIGGHEEVYPFELTVPNGPLTYHGSELNVDWYVEARADLAWDADPTAQAEFVLQDDGTTPLDHGPEHRAGPHPGDDDRGGYTLAILLVAGSLAVFGGVFFVFAPGALHDSALWIGIALALSCFGIVFVIDFLTGQGLRNAIVGSRLGHVDVSVSPIEVAGGDKVAVKVLVHPRTKVHLNGIRARLTAKEHCVSGTGTMASSWDRKLHDDVVNLEAPDLLERGKAAEAHGEVTIPKKAAPSFACNSNHLWWRIEVTVDPKGRLAWKQIWGLTVRPKRPPTAGG